MINNITQAEIDKALKNNVWHFGNEILYKMCKDNFEHIKDEHILAKVLFIGRIYAAAIERRKTENNDINDNFYINSVGPLFKESDIDKHLQNLRLISKLDSSNIIACLNTHHYLTNIIKKITNNHKRSFVSKYLHFHLPDLFYIYDTRAALALRNLIPTVPEYLEMKLKSQNIDSEYSKFYCKCFDLKRKINDKFKIELTTRQLDNLLIAIANNKNSTRNPLTAENK